MTAPPSLLPHLVDWRCSECDRLTWCSYLGWVDLAANAVQCTCGRRFAAPEDLAPEDRPAWVAHYGNPATPPAGVEQVLAVRLAARALERRALERRGEFEFVRIAGELHDAAIWLTHHLEHGCAPRAGAHS